MFNLRKKIIFSFISSLMILSLLSCSSEATPTPKVVFVTKEVPVEKIVEVVKEVEVKVPVEKIVEVIKEVEVKVPVEKIVEVIKEVEVKVPVEKIVKVEVIKEVEVKVPVEKIVKVEVIKEVIKEVQVPVEKIVEVEVIKEVIKEVEVPVEKVVIERIEVIVTVTPTPIPTPIPGTLVVYHMMSPQETISNSDDKKEEDSETSDATESYWAIPEQYKNVPIEQIKSQIEITDYMSMKGAATDVVEGDRESERNREALAQYTNKLITLEGVVNTTGTQKNAPLDIEERVPGKYEIWFCADKNQARKPCRYRAHLLYEGPEGKGDTLFTHDNVIRFWGVILGEQTKEVEKVVIERVEEVLKYSSYEAINRYPKIRVLQGSTKYIYGLEVVR